MKNAKVWPLNRAFYYTINMSKKKITKHCHNLSYFNCKMMTCISICVWERNNHNNNNNIKKDYTQIHLICKFGK